MLLPCHRAGAGGQEVTLHSHHPHGVMWVKIPQLHSPHHVPNLLEELELKGVYPLFVSNLKARSKDKASASSLRMEKNTAAHMLGRHLIVSTFTRDNI